MALLTLSSQFGSGGTGLTDGSLMAILEELRGFTTVVVSGAAENTNIAVTGLGATDHIHSCLLFDTGVPSLITPSAQSAGNVQFATATTGKQIVINFYNK